MTGVSGDRLIDTAFATMASDATWALSNLETFDMASDLPRPVQHGIDPRIEDVTNQSDSFPAAFRWCQAERSFAKQCEAWLVDHPEIADYKSFVLAASLPPDLEHVQNAHERLFLPTRLKEAAWVCGIQHGTAISGIPDGQPRDLVARSEQSAFFNQILDFLF
jgi:hypothetical protein